MLDIKRIREDYENVKAGVERRTKGSFGIENVPPMDEKRRALLAEVEAMKKAGRGANGHLAVGTNSVVRAKNYLESVKGVKFAEDSAVVKNGKLIAIYMEDEIGGFAVHLVQK